MFSLWLTQAFEYALFAFVLLLQDIRTFNSGDLKPPAYAQSISDLRGLERFEFGVAKNLTHFLLATDTLPLGSETRRLVHLYLTDFYQSSGYSDIQEFIDREETLASQNPICSYRLIRRVALLLKDLVTHKYFNRIFGPLCRNIVHFFLRNGWPQIEDLEILAEKILRIQLVHDLDVEQLANGRITSVQTNCTFNNIHCYEISKVATRTAQFSSAIQWLELAKQKAFMGSGVSPSFIEFSLWNAIEKHNMEFDEEIIMDVEPVFFDRAITHVANDSKVARKVRNLQYEAFKGMSEKPYENINYWGVCSGDNWQTEIEKLHLFCWYEFKVHHCFEIGPVKMEFLARNPDIVQMYDVIYENEIQAVISECGPRMIPSNFANHEYQVAAEKLEEKAYVLLHRTSVQSFCPLPKENDLWRKTELLTGLIAAPPYCSEDLQVLSYSVGGHIGPHMDEISTATNPAEFRIATWMLYFNDVKLGGETAFVSVGVSAKPITGSAVLWFDVFSDGSPDWTSNHASCPVLFGEKWAADKWVKYGGQIVKRKCGLKRGERYQFPVNNEYLPVPKIPGRD